MKLRILSWNMRGANDSDKRKVIKVLIKSQKVDLVCLQETKIQEMSKRIVWSLGVGRCLEWGVVNSRGASGGVLVFWDNRVLHLLEVKWGFSHCRAGLRIVMMISIGILQGFMILHVRRRGRFLG